MDGLGLFSWTYPLSIFFLSLSLYQELYGFAKGCEIGRIVSSYLLSIETPTPLSLGVGVMLCLVLWVCGSVGTLEVFFLCSSSSRPSGSVPSAP